MPSWPPWVILTALLGNFLLLGVAYWCKGATVRARLVATPLALVLSVVPFAGLLVWVLGGVILATPSYEVSRRSLGALLSGLGAVAFFAFGLWGFILELIIVNQAAGFWGIVVGIFVFPVTLVAAPWYALVARGDWLPLAVVYGGCAVAGLTVAAGGGLRGD